MSTKLAKLHDTTLAIRLPKPLNDQLEQSATAQYMKVSELVRHLIKEHLRQAQPFINAPQQSTKPRSAREAMSPAEREAWEKEWDY